MSAFDVAIVGAGPGGSAAAVALGQLGIKNVVLLDREGFPRDKTCGSGLSPNALKLVEQLGIAGHALRAVIASPILDGVADVYNQPMIRKLVVKVLGSALAGSSVSSQ